MPQLRRDVDWRNDSWPGRTTENLLEYIATRFRSISSRSLFVIFQIGTNDFTFGRDISGAGLAYEEIARSVKHMRSLGASVAVCTLLPRDDAFVIGGRWTSRHQESWAGYNDAVRGNSAGANLIIDLASDPIMGDLRALDDIELYADRLHPTYPRGWNYIAPHFAWASNLFLVELADN